MSSSDSELLGLVQQLAQTVATHEQQLTQIHTNPPQPDNPSGDGDLPEPNPAFDPIRDAAELRQWVDWLADQYYLHSILRTRTNGWETNTAIRNELLALKIAADHALHADKISPFGPITWHDALERFLGRVTDMFARGHRTNGRRENDPSHFLAVSSPDNSRHRWHHRSAHKPHCIRRTSRYLGVRTF